MEHIKIIVLLIIGLVLIIKGGDIFVDAAAWMAEKTGIPKVIIGATVVSLATTLPEMIVSFIAASEGKVDMAIGNAVGSVTANIGMVMGIALVCMPTIINRKEYMLKSLLMLCSAFIISAFGLTGSLGMFPNILLIIIFFITMIDNVIQANTVVKASSIASAAYTDTSMNLPSKELAKNIAKFVFGAVFIVIGSQLLVHNGSAIALLLGISERIIAISVIAIGTSLPELVTTISAISKKECSISVGNIIGANIIDLTLILPISSIISGKALPISSQFARLDLPVCLGMGCLALIPSLITKKFSRWQGICLVLFYIIYMIVTTMVI